MIRRCVAADAVTLPEGTFTVLSADLVGSTLLNFECEYRGKIPVKNAGGVDMYFVTGPKPAKG